MIAAPICIALSVNTLLPEWGRTPWSQSYFGVTERSSLSKYASSTILMWDLPQGYLVPMFPQSATFVRIRSNWGLDTETKMWERVQTRIGEAARQRMFLMDAPSGSKHDQQDPTLARLGLTRGASPCEVFSSFGGPFRICQVERLSP